MGHEPSTSAPSTASSPSTSAPWPPARSRSGGNGYNCYCSSTRTRSSEPSVRQFHGCYSVGDDQLWGVVRRSKGATNTLAALTSIRRARPDGAPIYVILDNLFVHKGKTIRAWATRNKVELCFTPTYASWANPIEAQFGPLRTFVIAGSNHANHPALTRHLHNYLRSRNANARHPDVLAAQRSESRRRWGQPATRAA